MIRRVFIVGCARSGTTLLQSLLAAHPEIISFPETFFFVRVVAHTRRDRLHLAAPNADAALRDLPMAGLKPRVRQKLPRLTVRQYVNAFVTAADEKAAEAGARVWIEKTPDHLWYLNEIERHVRIVHVIHVVREGRFVVASLRRQRRKYPETWGEDRPAQHLVRIWSRSVRESAHFVGRPNHSFVSYERLADDPAGVLHTQCRKLGVSSDRHTIDAMLQRYHVSVDGLTGSLGKPGIATAEPWKNDVTAAIANRNTASWESDFSLDERATIESVVARERDVIASIPFV